MPKEILNQEEFLKLAENASKCIVKRNPDATKLKLRVGHYLYTLKVEPDGAEEIIDSLNCPVEET